MKKIISIAIIGLMLSICFNINPVSSNSIESTDTGFTFYVDDDFNETTPGWNVTTFSKIRDAVDQADDDDRVFVYNGIYDENLLIEKSITLEGEDRDTTIINGNPDETVIVLRKSNVIINGFTIQHSFQIDRLYLNFYNGISIYSNNNNITHNIIKSNYIGIYIYTGENEIYDNVITNNKDGIKTNGKNNIFNNEIKYNAECGINISYSYNNIENNYIFENSYGILVGKNENLIYKNEIKNNKKGLFIYQTNNNNIYSNDIINNDYGFYTNKPTIQSYTSSINYIKHNNFIGNNNNLYRYKNDQFDSNYWDKWIGFFWYRIPGAPLIINFPLIGFYFNFDKHPARQPYDINLN